MMRLSKKALVPFALYPIGVTTLLLFIYTIAALAQTDPGPRPVGNQTATFPGPKSGGVALLPTPVVNTRQPADAIGNEGAGRVIAPNNNAAAGAAGKFWGNAGAVFGQLVTVNGATDPGSGNPTLIGSRSGFQRS